MTSFKDIPLTFVHPFYNDGEDRLPLHFEAWRSYPDWVWDNLKIVLIDDCSNPTLLDTFPQDNGLNINLKIYRIRDNLKYNLPGAWNLGFHVVDTEWLYAFDSDHIIPKDNLLKVLDIEARNNCFYQQRRERISHDPAMRAVTTQASGSWLVQKACWKQIDGFDEELTGARSHSWGWWEHDFTSRLITVGGFSRIIINTPIREYCPDWFGKDNNPHINMDKHTNRRRFRYKQHGLVEHPTEMLRFRWVKVYEQTRET